MLALRNYQDIRQMAQVTIARSLVESKVIYFRADRPNDPIGVNFRPECATNGRLRDTHIDHIAACMSSAGEHLCKEDCHAAVSVRYPYDPQKWINEGSSLAIAFAKACRNVMKPLGFHQARKKASDEGAYKVLVVDTFIGPNSDAMDETIETLCGMSIEVVGAVTFLGCGQQQLNGYPLASVFGSKLELGQYCYEKNLVPDACRDVVGHYIRCH